jgi:hypothetical protein
MRDAAFGAIEGAAEPELQADGAEHDPAVTAKAQWSSQRLRVARRPRAGGPAWHPEPGSWSPRAALRMRRRALRRVARAGLTAARVGPACCLVAKIAATGARAAPAGAWASSPEGSPTGSRAPQRRLKSHPLRYDRGAGRVHRAPASIINRNGAQYSGNEMSSCPELPRTPRQR